MVSTLLTLADLVLRVQSRHLRWNRVFSSALEEERKEAEEKYVSELRLGDLGSRSITAIQIHYCSASFCL